MGKWCIGIDLGGTFIKFVMSGESGQPTATTQLATPLDKGGQGVVQQMVSGARQIMAAHNVTAADVLGVGIGSPGPIRISQGVVIAMPNIPGMDNLPLRDLVSAGLGLPAVLENDANAAALGEFLCGAGKGSRDMVLLTLGTGLGSGIIIDGRILHGAHEIGGELGHVIVVPGGEKCGCGQLGCLERYCSAGFLAQRTARAIQQGKPSSLKAVLEAKGAIDARDINQARKAGDELAAAMWDEWAYYMAIGCVNICRIMDPDEIVLAGGMTKAGEDLLSPLRKHFAQQHWSLTQPQTTLAIASLGNDAGAIGAAGVAWQAFAAKPL